MRKIRRYALRVAERFKPRRIVLFGSYAYGEPNEDSDVDLLVVMRHRGATYSQATRIRCAIEPPFALDLLVRSPEELKKRLKLGDYLLREIIERGKVLYDASNKGVGAKARLFRRLRGVGNVVRALRLRP